TWHHLAGAALFPDSRKGSDFSVRFQAHVRQNESLYRHVPFATPLEPARRNTRPVTNERTGSRSPLRLLPAPIAKSEQTIVAGPRSDADWWLHWPGFQTQTPSTRRWPECGD